MTPLILLILAITLGRAAWVYLVPFPKCRRCGGTGRKVTKRRRGGHYPLCRRCRGTGRVRRRGSKLLHRAARVTAAELRRQRAARRARKDAERDDSPPRPRYR